MNSFDIYIDMLKNEEKNHFTDAVFNSLYEKALEKQGLFFQPYDSKNKKVLTKKEARRSEDSERKDMLPVLTAANGKAYYGLPYPLFLCDLVHNGKYVRLLAIRVFTVEHQSFEYFIQLFPSAERVKDDFKLISKKINGYTTFSKYSFLKRYRKAINSIEQYLPQYHYYPQMRWYKHFKRFDYFPITTQVALSDLPEEVPTTIETSAPLPHLRQHHVAQFCVNHKNISMLDQLLSATNRSAAIVLFATALFSISRYFFKSYPILKEQLSLEKTLSFLKKQITINVRYDSTNSALAETRNLVSAYCNSLLYDSKEKKYIGFPFQTGKRSDSERFRDASFMLPEYACLNSAKVNKLIFDHPTYIFLNAKFSQEHMISVDVKNLNSFDVHGATTLMQSLLVDFVNLLSCEMTNMADKKMKILESKARTKSIACYKKLCDIYKYSIEEKTLAKLESVPLEQLSAELKKRITKFEGEPRSVLNPNYLRAEAEIRPWINEWRRYKPSLEQERKNAKRKIYAYSPYKKDKIIVEKTSYLLASLTVWLDLCIGNEEYLDFHAQLLDEATAVFAKMSLTDRNKDIQGSVEKTINSFLYFAQWLFEQGKLAEEPHLAEGKSGWFAKEGNEEFLYLHYKTYYEEYIAFCIEHNYPQPKSKHTFQNQILFQHQVVILQQRITPNTYPRFDYRKTYKDGRRQCLKLNVMLLQKLARENISKQLFA